MATPVTKWDLISEEEREALDRTLCNPNMKCTGCGQPLATEGEFARHFYLYNPERLNLGYCPVKGDGGPEMWRKWG